MRQIQTLSINPIAKAAHYQYHFNVSQRTAYRMLDIDKEVLNKKHITFLDFFTLYEAFPAPNFKPHWVTMVCPQNLPTSPKMPVSASYRPIR